MDFSGNQFPFAFGAADNSTNNFANGFAPAGINDMPFNGVYGNTHMGVHNYGGAYNAPPQNVSLGHHELTQPIFAGMPTGYHPAAATPQGFPMANGHCNAPLPYGMHPGMMMALQRVQHSAIGFPMAPRHHNAPRFNGMRSYVSSGVALAGSPTVRAMSEQRPAPLVAPANLGNGDAYNALQFPDVAPVPVAPAARPAEVIDLTNEEPAAAPTTPAAGTKRARKDGTPKSSAKPARRPRYTAFGPYATPSATPPVINIPSLPPTPALSYSASVSDAEVLPATSSPPERPRVPSKRPADPYNLRGDIYYTYMTPKNPQLEENTRPVYSYPKGLPSKSAKSKRVRKGKKHSKASALAEEAVEEAVSESTSEPVSSPETVQAPVAEDGTDAEEDAVFEFEFDEDVIAPAAVTATPAAVDASAAEITFDAAEEERDDSGDLVFDDDGDVMTDAQGQPIALSVWRAEQAQAACTKPQDEELVLDTGSGDLPATVAAEKDTAPKRPTVSQKKLPSQRPTVSGKKIPSQRPTVPEKKIPLQRPTVSGKKIHSQKPAVSKKQATKRAPSPVSDDDDDDDLDLEAALQETAESAEDKRTLSDLEAKFGDYRQVRVKHDFEALQEALFDVWKAVDCRSGPLKDQWNAMMIRSRETLYGYWEYSEDDS
ncbi:hypothetical protein Q7P35_012287 [Cladosporium inversicolor]